MDPASPLGPAPQLALLAALPDGVIVADHVGCVIYHNTAAAALLGLSPDQLLGAEAATVGTWADDGGAPPFGFLTTGKAEMGIDRVLLRPDGSRVPIRVTQIALPGLGGAEVLHDESAGRDAAEMRADLGSTLNHDIRAGVSAVVLGLDAALSLDPDLSDMTRTFLDRALESCNRTIWLISDAHDVVRLEAGLSALKLELRTIGQVLDQGLQFVRDDAADAEIELRVEPHDPDCVLQVDVDRAARVVNNLAKIAVDGSSRGGCVVVGSVASREGFVGLTVRLTPHEAPPDGVERCFDAFRSAELRARMKALGPPCGFSYVRVCALAHGGEVACEVEGNELVFRAELPLSQDDTIEG